MSHTTEFDVIIVGGGPAGCSTALSLMRSNSKVSVLVIDEAHESVFRVGESLPAEASRVLAYLDPELPGYLRLGVEHGQHLHSTGNASAWKEAELHESYAITNAWGPGWHLDRAHFDETILRSVRRLMDTTGNGTVLDGRWKSVERKGSNWLINVDNNDTGLPASYSAKWIIDATGRKASVAKTLGARTVKRDDLLAFYVVFTRTEDVIDDDYRTVIEAAESGWFYTTQLPHHSRLVVYHTDGSDHTAKVARKLDGFLQLLQEQAPRISSLLQGPGYEILDEPGESYPKCTAACSSFLDPVWDENTQWCAIGDAAMAFDPLSSQGMLTALKTGSILGLELARRLGDDHSPRRSMASVYDVIRKDYEEKKAQYYGQVRRFESKFWRDRQTRTL